MLEQEEKYIDLLLKGCLNFNQSKSLFIHYDVIIKPFVEKIIKKAQLMGISDIGLDEKDINITHEKLKNTTKEEIEKDAYFHRSNWDIYANKGASFLLLVTEFPHFMDDINPTLIAQAALTNINTSPLYKKLQLSYKIPWCIAAFPNEYWAKSIYAEDDLAYNKLFNAIMKMCMVDTKDPIASWEEHLAIATERSTKLNNLKIKKLHYTNSLGTDLTIELPNNYYFQSAANADNGKMLVNMPSYEIFTSPDYRKTEGIVYSSKPLIYNGSLIDDFYLIFKEGKVIDYNAKIGKEILKQIIETDEQSCYLGEVALVNYNSPISNTGLVFGTTLIDENASCHLALGEGFPDAIENGLKLTKEELIKRGINQSKQHVDFMIGTEDLQIEAENNDGQIIIFKEGNFDI